MTQVSGGKRGQRPRVIRIAAAVALVVVVGAVLAACDTSMRMPTPTATARAVFTPTATSVPQVLYQADQAHGASGWHLPEHWQVSSGTLVNDGNGTAPAVIPITVTAASYTLTFQAQVRAVTPPKGTTQGEYGIIGEDMQGNPLYYAVLARVDPTPPHHSFSELYIPNSITIRTQDFDPGSTPRTFEVQVRDDEIKFFIDGSSLGSVVSPAQLVPSHLDLVDRYVQMTITSVTVTTP